MADPLEDAVVVAFLRQLAADRDAGRDESVEFYCSAFPGYEVAIRTEFDRVASREDGDESGRYVIHEELGHGGMGVVHRAFDRDLHRVVAMKFLREGSRANAERRFSREARITGALDHPGIVPVHEFGVDADGRPFFTMALVRGRNLRRIFELLAQGDEEWTLTRAIDVIVRVCDAVGFAHDRGVIHRDLKPSNIMVGEFGETYVMDWGLARTSAAATVFAESTDEPRPDDPDDPRHSDSTLVGDVLGTPAYMSPEQARGETSAIDERSDVFSIGAMLYHALDGRAPYAGIASSSEQLLDRVVAGPPPPLSRRHDVAPELVAIAERAMARDADERYPTATALGDDLRAFLDRRVVSAYETGALAELRKWVSRNRVVAALAASLVVAAFVGFAISLHLKHRSDAHAELADANFDLADGAIDGMLTRVGRDRLADEPRMQELRRDVLTEAASFRRRLSRNRPGDETARRALAEVLEAKYRSHRELGEFDEARAAAEEGVAILQRCVQDEPNNPDFWMGLATARRNIGLLELNNREFDTAAATFRAALADLERAIALAPGHHGLVGEKASMLNNLANTLTRRGAFEEAIATREQVVATGREILALEPELYRSTGLLCTGLQNLGITLARTGRPERAHVLLVEARDTLRAFASPPNRRTYDKLHASILKALSWVEHGIGEREAAIATLREAIEIQERLVTDFPEVAVHHAELGTSLNNLGNAAMDRGETELAIEHLQAAAACHVRALEIAEDLGQFRIQLDMTLHTLASLQLRIGDHVSAARNAMRLGVTRLPNRPGDEGAALVAQCAAAAAVDTALDEAQRTAASERYRAQALALLTACVEAGVTDLNRPEFDVLHDDPAFAALRSTHMAATTPETQR